MASIPGTGGLPLRRPGRYNGSTSSSAARPTPLMTHHSPSTHTHHAQRFRQADEHETMVGELTEQHERERYQWQKRLKEMQYMYDIACRANADWERKGIEEVREIKRLTEMNRLLTHNFDNLRNLTIQREPFIAAEREFLHAEVARLNALLHACQYQLQMLRPSTSSTISSSISSTPPPATMPMSYNQQQPLPPQIQPALQPQHPPQSYAVMPSSSPGMMMIPQPSQPGIPMSGMIPALSSMMQPVPGGAPMFRAAGGAMGPPGVLTGIASVVPIGMGSGGINGGGGGLRRLEYPNKVELQHSARTTPKITAASLPKGSLVKGQKDDTWYVNNDSTKWTKVKSLQEYSQAQLPGYDVAAYTSDNQSVFFTAAFIPGFLVKPPS